MGAGARERDPGGDAAVAALLAAVRDVVVEARGPDAAADVALDASLDSDLGLDSLALAEVLVRVEQRFSVRLPDRVLADAQTPRDLLDAVVTAAPGVSGAPPRQRPQPEAGVGVPRDAATLLDMLGWHVARQPDRPHVRILGDDGDVEVLTYGALHRDAQAFASGLRQRGAAPGSVVALMLPTGADYFRAFLGVLLAGCVPAPLYPPARPSGLEDHLRRHTRILDNAGAAALVTVPEVRPAARLVTPRVSSLRAVVTPQELRDAGGRAPRARPTAQDVALVQYTSGSTSDPKGVVLSHANLLANIRAMGQAGRLTPTDVFVSWLPLYHDMGLIGSWLLSLYFGIPFVVLSPLRFLTRPSTWLRALHEHQATLSGGPNFGYELCVRRIEDDEVEGVDLRRWRIAFNGAEPVSPDTVTRFVERFAPHGFRPGAMTPVYGLAECSVALTIPPLDRGARIDRVSRETLAHGRAVPAGPEEPRAARFVACGRPLPGHDLRIVDRDGHPLPDRHEGRVQFRGPSATRGYLRNPEATRRLLRRGWLDSGDLGYVADGDLHLTGRVKDVIIRAGRNLHPSELEEVVGEVGGIRKGCVAAFAATDPGTGTERLVVLAETRETAPERRAELERSVHRVAVDLLGTPPDRVVLAPPRTIPKTSSGKIRRSAARERYQEGRLDSVHRHVWWQAGRLLAGTVGARLRSGPAAVARTVYGVYAVGVAALAAAVVWVSAMVLPRDLGWRVTRRAVRAALRAGGIRLRVQGAQQLPSGPTVVVANHSSFLDPLVLAVVVPRPAVFTAVIGLTANPFVRLFLRRAGAHIIERGDRVRGVADVRALTEMVRGGRTAVFFPEGRRSPAPGLEAFHSGAFRVAADAGAEVVPVALRGTRHILPVGQNLPRRGPIDVEVLPPLRADDRGWAGAMALHRGAREALLEACGEPDLA